MIGQLIDSVTAHWSIWFDEDRPNEIVNAIMIRGTPDRRRLIVFLGQSGDRNPRLVAKLGFANEDVGSITVEHLRLVQASQSLPPEIANKLPQPYAFIRSDGWAALITSAVPGRSLLLPPIAGPASRAKRRLWRRYISSVVSFTRHLSDTTAAPDSIPISELCSTIDRFQERFPASSNTRRETLAFRRAVASASGEWRPAWQHGDVAVGNILEYRGDVRLVDWEHASPHSVPWADEAYIPSATVMLAMHQLKTSAASQVATAVLAKNSLLGGLLRDEIENGWRAPIPIGWAIALTAMDVALTAGEAGGARFGGWQDLAYGLIADPLLRSDAGSLCPRW